MVLIKAEIILLSGKQKTYPLEKLLLTIATVNHIIPLISLAPVLGIFISYLCSVKFLFKLVEPEKDWMIFYYYIGAILFVLASGMVIWIYMRWTGRFFSLHMELNDIFQMFRQGPSRLGDKSRMEIRERAISLTHSYMKNWRRYALLFLFLCVFFITRNLPNLFRDCHVCWPAAILVAILLVLSMFVIELPVMWLYRKSSHIKPKLPDDRMAF